MKQTEIGLIPDDWEVKTLENICVPQGIVRGPFGGALKKSMFVKIGYKVYEQRNAIYKNITDGEYYIDEPKFNEMNRFAVKANDYIISCSGTIGKIYKIPENFKKGIINQALLKLTIDEKIIFSDFFRVYFESNYFQNRIIDDTQGGAMKNLVGMEKFRKTCFPIPPLAEQQRIAKALSDVDSLISTTEKLIQKKKNIKQGTMQNLLTGKKRLPGFGPQTKSPTYKQTELGLIPDDWEVKKLSEFGTFSKGSGISREESNTGEYPAVRYGELYTTHNDYIKSFYSHISYEVASKSKKINKGDLLFTCSGETKEDIGKCVAFIGNEKAYAGGDLLILSPTVNIDSLFYGFLLNTTVAVKQKSSMAQGDAVVHISAESIGKIRVPFPSKEEQTSIANVLSSMDKEIETLNTKLEKYRNLKTAMMQQLLTGKIRL